jgi:hypothetical protein
MGKTIRPGSDNYYEMAIEPAIDRIISGFDGVMSQLEVVLDSPATGSLRESTARGNIALFCQHLITGRYEIADATFKVETITEEKR